MLFCVTIAVLYLIYACNTSFTCTEICSLQIYCIFRPNSILSELCIAFENGKVSGDICNRLCYNKTWEVLDFYKRNKIVITLKVGGQNVILKSQYPFIRQYEEVSFRVREDVFTDAVLDIVNEILCLGWPKHYKRHLIEKLWPTYVRKSHNPLTEADRRSLWALMAQEEFIVFRLLPLSRVTPRVIGTCGHFYQVEHLVPFRMKGYYTKLKAKILVHLMGTLKLFDEFLNEPLQWCDVKFDNLGLAAEYPKRFMVMDGDMLYTSSRLNKILSKRTCSNDEDCSFFDCTSSCNNSTGYCNVRENSNLEVFCNKLILQLFGSREIKSNRYLAACYDKTSPVEERLNSVRLAWAWNLADV
uniref:PIP49_C domain-containing protein n=1 Tax=Syphacia muris TaxID=451379 RepID=A0A0N5AHW1_9BILA